MAVAEGCPAFTQGCPFADVIANAKADDMSSIVESLPVGIAAECPAFKDGCPFKLSDSVENLYNQLSEMPATHRVGQDTKAAKVVEDTLKKVHAKSKERKESLHAECPVFATSCPFKTVTSDGELLVQKLDDVLTSWDLGIADGQQDASPQAEVDDKPLSSSLKAGTKSVHRAAENVRFVRDFLRGVVPKESYIELLKALYHVYNSLERALDELPENLQHIDFALLRRTATLEADLRFYLGLGAGVPLEAQVGPPSPAALTYVERLQHLAREEPYLLLAHAYTRYLGDLSGGQILARSAAKAYGLPANAGAAFYAFEAVGTTAPELKAFKKSYRASLDALRLSTEKADALVAESTRAFIMNMLLFEERDVAAGHLPNIRSFEEVLDMVKVNQTPLGFQKAYGGAKPSGKCPFLPSPGDEAADGKPAGVCPWPFVWMHDPRAAWALHPVKNISGLLALAGLARAAWRYPRQVGLGLAVTFFVLPLFKPKKKKPSGH